MVLFSFAFLAIVALAVGVMALVAVQARRDGRELLTPHGEQLVQSARERTTDLASDIASAARSAAGNARDDAHDGAPAAAAELAPAPAERRAVQRAAPVRPAAEDGIDLRDRDDISA